MSDSIEVDILKKLLESGKFPLLELSQMLCPGSGIALLVRSTIDSMNKSGLVCEIGHSVELTQAGIERALLVAHG